MLSIYDDELLEDAEIEDRRFFVGRVMIGTAVVLGAVAAFMALLGYASPEAVAPGAVDEHAALYVMTLATSILAGIVGAATLICAWFAQRRGPTWRDV